MTVELPTSGNGTAIYMPPTTSAPAIVEDSTLGGYWGVNNQSTGIVTVQRCSVIAQGAATDPTDILSTGTTLVDDSVLRVVNGSGLTVQPHTGSASIVGTQLTILGDSNSFGLNAQPSGGATASVNLSDSIIANPMRQSIYTGSGGTVTTHYSDYDHTTVHSTGTFASSPTDAPVYVDPRFANAPAGDFRLDATSPLIDFDKATALGATPLGPTESATDELGVTRITGGGRDLGALQHQPPTVTASVSPGLVGAGSPAVFSAVGAVGTPGDSLSYTWRFDDGTTATGPTVAQAFSTTGAHSGTVTATDLTGLSVSETVPVTVTPVPVALPSNAFSVTSKRVSKSGVVTLGVLVHAAGRLTAGATFTRTVIHFSSHGRHRRRHTVHETVVYATTSANATRAGTFTLTLKPTSAARKLLKADKKLELTLVIAFAPPGDSLNRAVLHLTVTAPKPPKRKPKHHG